MVPVYVTQAKRNVPRALKRKHGHVIFYALIHSRHCIAGERSQFSVWTQLNDLRATAQDCTSLTRLNRMPPQ